MNVLYVGNNAVLIERLSLDPNISLEVKSNGFEALRYMQGDEIVNLICVEYNLPGHDGLYLINKIRKSKKLRNLPAILLQAEYNPKIYKQSFKKGVDDYYILKPQSFEKIVDRINGFNGKTTEVEVASKPNKKLFRIPTSKRIFDIVVASGLLLVLSPILLLIILAIRLESKGKIYYTSKRVGRKTFDFYKLRSMKVGADKLLKELAKKNNQYSVTKPKVEKVENTECAKCAELPDGEYCSPLKYNGSEVICEHMFLKNKEAKAKQESSFIKIVDDPRITKIGKFIRNTSIDELPQLINVIKGDMSLVGNRPLPVYEAETLTKDQMSKRFLAPAGITGLWQVELRGKGGDMSEEERIELDNKYADYFTNDKYSFWFDMRILLRTVPALFQQSTV